MLKIFVVLQSLKNLFNLHSTVKIFYWLMLNIQGLELNDYTFKKIFLSLVFCKSNFITTLYVLCCNEAKQKNHQSSEAITKVRERWYQRSNSLVPKSHFIMCLSLLENKVGLSPEDLAWLLQHLLSCWKSQNPPAGKMNQKFDFCCTWIQIAQCLKITQNVAFAFFNFGKLTIFGIVHSIT